MGVAASLRVGATDGGDAVGATVGNMSVKDDASLVGA